MLATSNKRFFVIVMFGFLVLLIMMSNLPTTYIEINAKAEAEFLVTAGMFDDYTNSDTLLNMPSKTISEYKTDVSLYRSTASIETINNQHSLTVEGDDPIVNIVPKELFINIGDHLYIGKEYGFYVNTIAQSTNSPNRRSTVMVFDIIANYDTNMRYSLRVEPLFQYEYAYLTYGNTPLLISNGNDYSVNVYYFVSQAVVIPIPRYINSNFVYAEVEEFYLKDIAFAAQIFNEQGKNYYDTGYNAVEDRGSFFTEIEYTYDGYSRDMINTPLEQDVLFAVDTVSLLLGAVSLCVQDPIISTTASVLSLAFAAGSWVHNFATTNYLIFQDGQLTNENISSGRVYANEFPTTAEGQLNTNACLVKSLGFCVNTNGQDTILYGTGKNATAKFTISNSGDDYFRIYREIGVQVVDSNGNQKSISNSQYYDTYGTPDSITLNLESEESIYLLNNGSNTISFTANYLSDYIISVDTTESVLLKVNNEPVNGEGNVFNMRLNANSLNQIEVYGNVDATSGVISITPSTALTNISIPATCTYLLAYDVDNIFCKNITISNTSAEITGIKTFNGSIFEEYMFNSIYTYPASSISTPLTSGMKYFLISNTSSQEISTNVVLTDVEVLTTGNNTNQTIVGNNYTFKKFISSTTGSFAFTFNFEEVSLEMGLLDASSNIVNVQRTTKTMIYSNMSGIYWICYRAAATHSSSIGEIIINESNDSYQWKVNGTQVLNNSVSLEVGDSYEIAFIINNVELIEIWNKMETPFGSVNNNILGIAFDAPTNQKLCELVPLGVLDAFGIQPELEVLTLPSSKISITGSVNNQTALGFNWQVKPGYNITEFKYAINGVGKPSAIVSSTTGTISVWDKANSEAEVQLSISITQVKVGDGNFVAYHGDSTKAIVINSCYAAGTGTSSDPFLISCIRHFNNINKTSKQGTAYHYRQTINLDFGNTATPRGVAFYGTYTPNGKSIKNIVVSDNSSLVGGLFSENYGYIYSFSAVSVTIDATHSGVIVGGLAGKNYGTLNGALITTVNITSRGRTGAVGGIVGVNESGASVNGTSVIGNIKVKSDVGGIIGVNNGTLNGGLCTANIQYYQQSLTNRSVGGVVGLNNPAGRITGTVGYGGTITFGGYTGIASSWTGIVSELDFAPRMGRYIGENCASLNNIVTPTSSQFGSATIDKTNLTTSQQVYVEKYNYIGNNNV